jgi:hypothetical protein
MARLTASEYYGVEVVKRDKAAPSGLEGLIF